MYFTLIVKPYYASCLLGFLCCSPDGTVVKKTYADKLKEDYGATTERTLETQKQYVWSILVFKWDAPVVDGFAVLMNDIHLFPIFPVACFAHKSHPIYQFACLSCAPTWEKYTQGISITVFDRTIHCSHRVQSKVRC